MRTYATILVLLLTVPAYAVDTLQVTTPEPLSEAWRWTEFNLPGTISDVFEDRDGIVWFATDKGLVKYDGYSFRTLTTEDGLASNDIRTVAQTRDGDLWVATGNDGITRLSADSVRTYTTKDGLAGSRIGWKTLIPSIDDGLWAGFAIGERDSGGLSYFDGRTWSTIPTPTDMLRVVSLTEARDGALWIASMGQGLLRYRGGEWSQFGLEEGLPGMRFDTICEASDGSVWATSLSQPAIVRYKDDRWTVYRTQDGLSKGPPLYGSIWEGRDGRLWALSRGGDFVTFAGGRWRNVDSARRPASAYTVFSRDRTRWVYGWRTSKAYLIRLEPASRTRFDVGRELQGGHRAGAMWFVTEDGPVGFDGRHWFLYGPEDGLLEPPYTASLATEDGSVWFQATHGLCRYVKGRWEVHRVAEIGLDRLSSASSWVAYSREDGSFWIAGSRDGKAGASQYDPAFGEWRVYQPDVGSEWLRGVFVAANGDIWFDTVRPRQGVMRYDGASWTQFTTDDGLSNRIFGFGQSADGKVWAGTRVGLSWFDGSKWQSYGEGIPGTRPYGFQVAGKDLWCAHAEAGVSRYDGTAWHTYSTDDGLAAGRVRHLLPGSDGTIWVATDGGIRRFSPDTETWSSYAEDDGIAPGSIRRLWERDSGIGYTARSGVAGLVRPDTDPPKSAFKVAPTDVGSSGNVMLTWAARDLWDVTPPDEVQYQYRLDDEDWSSGTDRTDVTLTSLSSGSHRIEIRAIDDELNVEETPVVHAFVVEAPWWRNPVVAGPGLLLVIAVLFQSARVVQGKRKLQDSVDALSSANNELFQVNRDLESVNVDLQREQVLERLRGQAQGMQSSEDIGGVVEAVYRELTGLGLPLIDSGFEIDLSETVVERWYAAEDGRAMEPYVTAGSAGEAQRRGDDSHLHLEGEKLKEAVRRVVAQGNLKWKAIPEDRWPQKADIYPVFFEGGRVVVSSEEPIAEEYLTLIKRFGEVFGYAHSRWEELKQKEAQNRRLAVEASVQRLRAEVQSMDEASDFERILSLLTESLKTVELSFDGCEIDVLDEPVENPTMELFEANGFKYTTYTLDPNGHVASESFPVPAPFPAVVRETIERFIADEPWQALIGGTRAILEVPAGNYGRLRLIASERENFDDDEVATLREFADAVALGYARYLDIREIQEQTERKSAFLASMSHELRTPMNAIKGFTNLVLGRRSENLNDQQRENLGKVSQASDHLLGMIDDLLDLSKIEAGSMDVNPERFDVGELVTSACDTVSPLIQDGVELRQHVADDIGEANSDKARLQQMVINLLSNAIKFTDSGSVTVSADTEDGQLVIGVSDTGKGVKPPRTRLRIWAATRRLLWKISTVRALSRTSTSCCVSA